MAVITLSFYDPSDGSLLGTLDDTQCKQIQMRPALFELGAGSFTVSRHLAAAQADMLQKGVIVIPTVPAISSTPFWGFILADELAVLISHDEQGGEDITLSGPGIMSILGNATLDEDTYAPVPPASEERGSSDTPGEWLWRNQPQGAILDRAVEEGIYQPGTPLGLVTSNFNRTIDSNAVAWEVIVHDYIVPTGTNVLELADRLAQTGEFYPIMRPVITAGVLSLQLSVYQTLGTDLSGSVSFEKGVNVLTELNRQLKYTRITHLVTKDADGNFETFVTGNAYDQATYAFLDIPETNDPDTIERIAVSTIDASEINNEEYELEVTPVLLPYADYDLGDTVNVHTGSGEHDLNNTAQRVVAVRIVLDEAAVTGQDRSLRIVLELSYREMRGMAGTNNTVRSDATGAHRHPPNPQLCRPTLAPGDPTPGTPSLDVLWTWETDAQYDTSHTYEWMTGTATAPGALSGVWGWNGGGQQDQSSPRFPVSAGDLVAIAGDFAAQLAFTTQTRTLKVYWYVSLAAVNEFAITSIPIPASGSGVGAIGSVAETVVAPVGATYFTIHLLNNIYANDVSVTIAGEDEPGAEGVPGSGHPDIVGSSNRASRCDHAHHVTRESSPGPNDDALHGYPAGTLWIVVDDVDNPTAILEEWRSLSAADGTALWVPEGVAQAAAGITVEEDGGAVTSDVTHIVFDGATVTDDGGGQVTVGITGGGGGGVASPITYIRKTADQSVSTTALADSTGLVFAVAANKVYKFRLVIFYSTNATSVGIKLGVIGPTGCAILAYYVGAQSAGTGAAAATIISGLGGGAGGSDLLFIAPASGPGSASTGFIMEGIITTAATAGTLQVRHGSETATATTVLAQSHGEIVDLAALVGGPTVVYKSADEVVNNSTTLQDDNHLMFAIGASEVWVAEYHLYYGGGNITHDLKWGFSVPSGATMRYGGIGADASRGASVEGSIRNQVLTSGSPVFGSVASGTGDLYAVLSLYVVNSTTPGNVVLQWAQQTAAAVDLTLRAGSWLSAKRVL